MTTIPPARQPEPWMRGTLTEVPPIQRAILHAFELAIEDVVRWCSQLADEQLNARPHGLPSVAFQLRHIVGASDRLLTYAEGQVLNSDQLAYLRTELDAVATRDVLFAAFRSGLEQCGDRVRAFDPTTYAEPRAIGKRMLPTTVGGILVHVADHTMRHVGQAITTTKIIMAS